MGENLSNPLMNQSFATKIPGCLPNRERIHRENNKILPAPDLLLQISPRIVTSYRRSIGLRLRSFLYGGLIHERFDLVQRLAGKPTTVLIGFDQFDFKRAFGLWYSIGFSSIPD